MAKINFLTRCKAYLKADDDSIIVRVITKAEKECNSNIRNASQAIGEIEYTTGVALDKLEDRLVDAKEALKHSYMEINIEKCKTSDGIENFIETTYLENIATKLAKVKDIEAQIKATKEAKEAQIKSINETAQMYKDLLAVLASEE